MQIWCNHVTIIFFHSILSCHEMIAISLKFDIKLNILDPNCGGIDNSHSNHHDHSGGHHCHDSGGHSNHGGFHDFGSHSNHDSGGGFAHSDGCTSSGGCTDSGGFSGGDTSGF